LTRLRPALKTRPLGCLGPDRPTKYLPWPRGFLGLRGSLPGSRQASQGGARSRASTLIGLDSPSRLRKAMLGSERSRAANPAGRDGRSSDGNRPSSPSGRPGAHDSVSEATGRLSSHQWPRWSSVGRGPTSNGYWRQSASMAPRHARRSSHEANVPDNVLNGGFQAKTSFRGEGGGQSRLPSAPMHIPMKYAFLRLAKNRRPVSQVAFAYSIGRRSLQRVCSGLWQGTRLAFGVEPPPVGR
jgi:hypothetical protein